MRILFTFLISISITACYSQIEVVDMPKEVVISTVKSGGDFHCSLSYGVDEKDTTYTFSYRNSEYSTITDIQSVSFDSYGGTLDKLYNLMKSFFSKENKKNKEYQVSIVLGKSNVVMRNTRAMGFNMIIFSGPNGYTYLSEKNVDKLFGKH